MNTSYYYSLDWKFDYIIDLINISNDPASELNKKFTYKVNYSDGEIVFMYLTFHMKWQNFKFIKSDCEILKK